MAKYLTYDELMKLALENYEQGGADTYECIDEKTFNTSEAHFNKMTKADALKMFARDLDIWKDRQGW